jgi:hypothetical protein
MKYSEIEKKQSNITIQYESKIIDVVRKDNHRNNTIHFVWDRTPFEPNDFVLQVVTRNVQNGQLFLLKQVEAPTHTECLKQMLDYVKGTFKEDSNWTVFWVDVEGHPHMSYFRGKDQDEVRAKFDYDKNGEVEIVDIRLNPIA